MSEELRYERTLQATTTDIPGLVVFDLPVHGDNRGWFKENWQRAKEVALGLPDFGPVQNNISFNATRGTTRGIHAEPWDKYISVATGAIFGAWVDLREGPTFGAVHTQVIRPDQAIFVPRGVGNAFQTLEDATAYSYLVNDHWSADKLDQYSFVNLADETLAIDWPIPLEQAELSDKDRNHPKLADAKPVTGRTTLVLGANGQLGRALKAEYGGQAVYADRTVIDMTSDTIATDYDWSNVGVIINAAAYTNVDGAETLEGRRAAWQINVNAVCQLVDIARTHHATLVNISSDYVFDGIIPVHDENEPVSPLGVYGQTKAAADQIVATLPAHYTIRTSWVIGDGNNFVKTMWNLAKKGVKPSVVNDQHGRLTFTTTLAAGIHHLIDTHAAHGTYNITNSGPVQSWADIAKTVYEAVGANPDDVTPVSTADYYKNKTGIAPRPEHSTLTLDRVQSTGLSIPTAATALSEYVSQDWGNR
ncbi:sugar nucleotide-binding protein [Pseudoclavibacter sp. CFCC 13611]|uniref:sugar nucleotide-binding protein n=1 Tax=Pseudoclavibacter sp. CFCC 13611 TaxID=2615178 RepID=UPI001CE40FFA|nr:bifunctional dTDP-4-dehydrorhamnose 3,5-epimerase family protein/NAD(P)-dependent oxidoreductase [Pseudoclavibacter sp. CFCC 13611]